MDGVKRHKVGAFAQMHAAELLNSQDFCQLVSSIVEGDDLPKCVLWIMFGGLTIIRRRGKTVAIVLASALQLSMVCAG